jgi:hypothetical protein
VNPATARSSAGRGKNKGNCSFFARSARCSSGRGRISIFLETSSHLLLSPITFRSPRPIPFFSTKPANFTIELTIPLHRQTIHRQTTFQSIDRQLAKGFHPPDSLHCSDPASISQTSCKIAVFPARSQVARWRSTTRRPTIGPTDPANGRRAPSRCRPPCLRLEP